MTNPPSLFDLLQRRFGAALSPIHTSKAVLIRVSHMLETLVMQEQFRPIIYTGFQHSDYWTKEASRYHKLAESSQFVTTFAMGDYPDDGPANELHIHLPATHPLCGEWFLAIISEHMCVVLCARDLHEFAEEEQARQFETVFLLEPTHAIEVANFFETVVAGFYPEQAKLLSQARLQLPAVHTDMPLAERITNELLRIGDRLHYSVRQQAARLRAVSHLTTDYLFVVEMAPTQGQERIWFSEGFLHSTGYTPDEMRTTSDVLKLISGSERDSLVEDVLAMLARGETEIPSIRIEHKDGTERWMHVYLHQEIDPETKKIVRLIGASQDITAEVLAKRALEQSNDNLSLSVSRLERSNRDMELLHDMSEMLQIARSFSDLHKALNLFLPQFFPQCSGVLNLINQGHIEEVPLSEWGRFLDFTPEKAGLCPGLQTNVIQRRRTDASQPYCVNCPPGNLLICAPLVLLDEVLGILHMSIEGVPEDEEQTYARLVMLISKHIALAVSNIRLRETLREQAIRDPLTGLHNRRYMEESLERELHRAARKGMSLGLMVADIDSFKQINDQFGHEAGDAVLRELAEILRNSVRREDIVCRFGGEEFVLILPEASLEVTHRRARRVSDEIRALRLSFHGLLISDLSVSIGVSAFPNHGNQADVLVRAADTAMYSAKSTNRGNVVIAEQPEEQD